MEWKTDTNRDAVEERPDVLLMQQKPARLIDKAEIPMILIGAALFILIILFIVFIPKKDKVNVDEFRALASRLSSLEQRLEALEDKSAMTALDYDVTKYPVDAQQLVNWTKENSDAILAIAQKITGIETHVKGIQALPPEIAGIVIPPPAAVNPPRPPGEAPAAKAAATVQPTAPDSKPAKSPALKPALKTASRPKPRVTPSKTLVRKPVQKPKPVVAARKPHAAPAAGPRFGHQVTQGENLFRISKKYGISVEKLREMNGMKPGELTIRTGQVLRVEEKKP